MSEILLTEWRLHLRHGVVAAMVLATGIWCLGILLAPQPWRVEIGSLALFFDLAGVGLFFVPALTAVERGSGVSAARRLGAVRPVVFLGVRVIAIGAISLLAAAAVLSLAGATPIGARLAGVFGLAILLSLAAVATMGGGTGLTEYLARMPFVVVPLLVPPLLEISGLVSSPLLGLSPVTSAMRLIRGAAGILDATWLIVCIGVLVLPAVRAWNATDVSQHRRRPGPRKATSRIETGWSPWHSHFAVDRRTLAGDRLLLLVVSGVPLLALAVRWLGGAGAEWLAGRWGVEIEPLLPFVWAFVLVVHAPMMFGGVSGLLFLEDRDHGVLPAVAATRSSLFGILAWRLVATASLTGLAVLIAVPIAGATHPAGWEGILPAALAAGAASTTAAMTMATLGRDRVQGMAVMKAMGLPFYAPLALWIVGGAAGAALLLIPTGWAVQAFWAESAAAAWLWALGGTLWSALLTGLLARRFSRSVVA